MPSRRFYQRFAAIDRVMHGFMMASFLGLAGTGMPLLFSEAPWANRLARLFGGFAAAGTLHRLCATMMIGVFLVHLGRICYRVLVQQELGMLWGPESMVPQPIDVIQLVQHLGWFVGFGQRPKFDRYTYWEKFDYWAVFWGMGIIGGSGLVLWFPTVFAWLIPGTWFNIALLIHGEEALLAVGFIFTIHFFNTHLRPEKFPMDRVIFNGRLTEYEMRDERPAEYERLARTGGLEPIVVGEEPGWLLPLSRVVATVAVGIGLSLVVLIVYAVFLSS